MSISTIDTIVQEIRAVRREHLAKFNGNVDLAFADIAQHPIALKAQGWTFVNQGAKAVTLANAQPVPRAVQAQTSGMVADLADVAGL